MSYYTVKAAKAMGVHHMSQDVFPVPGAKLTDHAAPTLQTYNNKKLRVRYNYMVNWYYSSLLLLNVKVNCVRYNTDLKLLIFKIRRCTYQLRTAFIFL